MSLAWVSQVFTSLLQMGALAFLLYLIQQSFMQNPNQLGQRLRNQLAPPAPSAAPELPPAPAAQSKSKKKKGKKAGGAAEAEPEEPEVSEDVSEPLRSVQVCTVLMLPPRHAWATLRRVRADQTVMVTSSSEAAGSGVFGRS